MDINRNSGFIRVNFMGHFYLIIEREFLSLQRKIYKIGKSFEISVRKFGYPKGSVLILCYFVDNPLAIERLIMTAFSKNPTITQELQIGREYFSGNVTMMKAIIHNIVLKNDSGYDFATIKTIKCNRELYDIFSKNLV